MSIPIVCFPEARQPQVVQNPSEAAALPCIAESHPPATVSWYRILNNTRHQLHSRGKTSLEIEEYGDHSQTVLLKIHNVSQEDYGQYACVAVVDDREDELLITLAKPSDFSSASKLSNLLAFSTFNLVIYFLIK